MSIFLVCTIAGGVVSVLAMYFAARRLKRLRREGSERARTWAAICIAILVLSTLGVLGGALSFRPNLTNEQSGVVALMFFVTWGFVLFAFFSGAAAPRQT